MKKTFALLLACLMLVAMLPGTAMAYQAVTLTSTTFPHVLELTYALNTLEEGVVIGYKYTVGAAQMMVMHPTEEDGKYTYTYTDVSNINIPAIEGNYEVNGNKAYVVFNKESTFDANKKSTVNVNVNWSDVSITEPGIYVWPVTKALDANITTVTTGTTDYNTECYLYAIVLRDNNDTLTVKSYGISDTKELQRKESDVNDQYPAQVVSLTIGKEIDGNMASSNQYFSFVISIATNPAAYEIVNRDGTPIPAQRPATVYNPGGVTNNTTVNVNSNGWGTATIWLKAGETATINGLPYGTFYNIIEGGNEGYSSVDVNITGDQTPDLSNVRTDYKVEDTSLTSDTTVTYINTKNATVPTGITLNTAAPVMGILLAMSLLVILLAGKRKEYVA